MSTPTNAAEWRALRGRNWDSQIKRYGSYWALGEEEIEALLAYCERLEAALLYWMAPAPLGTLVDTDAPHHFDLFTRRPGHWPPSKVPQASPENVSSRAARDAAEGTKDILDKDKGDRKGVAPEALRGRREEDD
mgnify:CR=1 FL=1